MYPEITITISMTHEGVEVTTAPPSSEQQDPAQPAPLAAPEALPDLIEDQLPEPPSYAALAAMPGAVGEALELPSLPELEAWARESGQLPEPPSLAELEAAATEESVAPWLPTLAELQEIAAVAHAELGPPSLVELGAMGQETSSPLPVSGSEQTNRCQAITKAGTRCKNRPLEASVYCYVHQPA